MHGIVTQIFPMGHALIFVERTGARYVCDAEARSLGLGLGDHVTFELDGGAAVHVRKVSSDEQQERGSYAAMW